MLTPKEIIAELVSVYGSLEAAMFDGETYGICYNCGNIQPGVEPDQYVYFQKYFQNVLTTQDTRMYRCKNCGEDEVYGIEETIMTLV